MTGRNTPTGYMVELCQAIVQKLRDPRGKAPAVRFITIPTDKVESDMRDGFVDLLCSATTDTPERRSMMAFSHPVFIASLKVLVRKDDPARSVSDLQKTSVAVLAGTTAHRLATARSDEWRWNIAPALTSEAALSQVELGWARGFARDDVLLAAQLITGNLGDRYRLLPDPLSEERIAIAVRSNAPELLAAVNRGIALLARSGEIEKLHERWFMQPVAPYTQALGVPIAGSLKAAFAELR